MVLLSSPAAVIQSIPPVTRAFTAATVLSSAFYAWLRWSGVESTPYLTLVPGASIFYPWTFVTSALIETSVLEFIATLVFVPASLKYLESLWGSIEIIKFIVVSVGFSNVIAFGLNWIEYIVLGDAELLLYGMEYHGQMALQTAILVAFTQLIPEHQVQVMGVLRTRVKNIPMAYLTLSTVLCLVGYQCPWIVIQFGWFVGWIYLRFYKKNSGDSVGGTVTYGDRSETFSLLSWFPPFAHYPLTLLGNIVFNLATRLHLLPASAGDLESGMYSQVPGGARAEAERRRAMALKALDQRMANASPAGGSSSNSPVQGSPAAPAAQENGSAPESESQPTKA
ncbi:eukaryotic integral membrane protein [Schizophyllum amplum]|uniref:Eukaryotic integral membrane protein n=1 Tax=Schizophyllum amplum TaxID=97359 RepID=A0A550CMT2_9AGAR|nr:eukaryotic integral membrane protein [Auriculariopsis ampla]